MRIQIFRKTIALTIVSLMAVLLAVPLLAQSVTQAYSTDSVLRRGMIVGLNAQNLRKVETISSDQYEQMHGVVVGSNDSAILLDSETETIYVATTGRVSVLVNNQNGNIAAGDYVTVSAVSGIGMKASSSDQVVLGKAIESYDANNTNQVISTVTVKDSNNQEKQLGIGQILVDINISKNPLLATDNSLPSILRKASELIAGRPVSSVRVYISLAVLAVASIIAGSLLYSAVRSSLIAIGRNPLSKKMIMRSVMQVFFISAMIFLSGAFGVYLLLKL
jgi:hypothetical protein